MREIGLLSTETGECNVNTEEDPRTISSSRNYQTLSSQAARLIWKDWHRPDQPPMGAVSAAEKQQKYIATSIDDPNSIGYMDPRINFGSAIFPQQTIPKANILVEIDPERYDLYDIELKESKNFIKEEIILTTGKLKYETEQTGYEYADESEYDDDGDYELSSNTNTNSNEHANRSPNSSPSSPNSSPSHSRSSKQSSFVSNKHRHYDKFLDELETETEDGRTVTGIRVNAEGHTVGRLETVLSYEKESNDYWGNGNLMAKGLHTYITLPDDWSPRHKVIEWGLPLHHPSKSKN